MDGTLTLNDGTVMPGSTLLESTGQLFIYVMNGSGIRDVFNLLIEPTKTCRITALASGVTTVKEGFTRLIAVRDEGNGLITAVLGK